MSTQALKEFKEGYHDNLMNKLDETYLKKTDVAYKHSVAVGDVVIEYISLSAEPLTPDNKISLEQAVHFIKYKDALTTYFIFGWFSYANALVIYRNDTEHIPLPTGTYVDTVTRL